MSEFNEAQKICAATYGGGDYAHVTTIDECGHVGDTLFLFLMRELATSEDCTDRVEACRRLQQALEEVENVYAAVRIPLCTVIGENDFPVCPTCGVRLEIDTEEVDGVMQNRAVDDDELGPIYLGVCMEHGSTLFQVAESEDEDADGS